MDHWHYRATYASPSQSTSRTRRQDGPMLCGICGKPMRGDILTLECGHRFHTCCVVSMSECNWNKCTICLLDITDYKYCTNYTSPSQPSTSRRQDGPLCGLCGKPMCADDWQTLGYGKQAHKLCCVVNGFECLLDFNDNCVICFEKIARADERMCDWGHKSHRRCTARLGSGCPVCPQEMSDYVPTTASPSNFSSPLVGSQQQQRVKQQQQQQQQVQQQQQQVQQQQQQVEQQQQQQQVEQQQEPEECSICLEIILHRDAKFLMCGHKLHKACFNRLRNVEGPLKCPICRHTEGDGSH